MWLLLALLLVPAAWGAWRWRLRSRLGARWMRDAWDLGFRVDPRVSPVEMVRDRHTVRMHWSPVNGRPCLEVFASLAQPIPFRMFASTDSDRDLLVPMLPRLKLQGFTGVAADDQDKATRLLELASARLLKLAAAATVEVSERAAMIRLPETASAERISLALEQASEAASCLEWAASKLPVESKREPDLRWSGSRYEGKVPRAGATVTVLYCDAPFEGERLTLDSLGPPLKMLTEQLETIRKGTAARLLDEDADWFETGAPDADTLSRELTLDTVRLSHVTKDVTLYLAHQAFSGHFIEVAITSDGTITSVELSG